MSVIHEVRYHFQNYDNDSSQLLLQLDDSFFENLPSLISERRLKMMKRLFDNDADNDGVDSAVRVYGSPISEGDESSILITEEFSILNPSSLPKEEQVKPIEPAFPWMSLFFFLSLYIYYYRWDTLVQLIQKLYNH